MPIEKLAGTDRRSIGLANEIAEEIAADQARFDEVFAALFVDDPVVRMRAADAIEKASRRCPERLHPHRRALLDLSETEQQEVRWHVAQMLPRLALTEAERRRAFGVLEAYRRDASTIVRVNALEALVVMARGDADWEARARHHLEEASKSSAPAERARARKLSRGSRGRRK